MFMFRKQHVRPYQKPSTTDTTKSRDDITPDKNFLSDFNKWYKLRGQIKSSTQSAKTKRVSQQNASTTPHDFRRKPGATGPFLVPTLAYLPPPWQKLSKNRAFSKPNDTLLEDFKEWYTQRMHNISVARQSVITVKPPYDELQTKVEWYPPSNVTQALPTIYTRTLFYMKGNCTANMTTFDFLFCVAPVSCLHIWWLLAVLVILAVIRMRLVFNVPSGFVYAYWLEICVFVIVSALLGSLFLEGLLHKHIVETMHMFAMHPADNGEIVAYMDRLTPEVDNISAYLLQPQSMSTRDVGSDPARSHVTRLLATNDDLLKSYKSEEDKVLVTTPFMTEFSHYEFVHFFLFTMFWTILALVVSAIATAKCLFIATVLGSILCFVAGAIVTAKAMALAVYCQDPLAFMANISGGLKLPQDELLLAREYNRVCREWFTKFEVKLEHFEKSYLYESNEIWKKLSSYQGNDYASLVGLMDRVRKVIDYEMPMLRHVLPPRCDFQFKRPPRDVTYTTPYRPTTTVETTTEMGIIDQVVSIFQTTQKPRPTTPYPPYYDRDTRGPIYIPPKEIVLSTICYRDRKLALVFFQMELMALVGLLLVIFLFIGIFQMQPPDRTEKGEKNLGGLSTEDLGLLIDELKTPKQPPCNPCCPRQKPCCPNKNKTCCLNSKPSKRKPDYAVSKTSKFNFMRKSFMKPPVCAKMSTCSPPPLCRKLVCEPPPVCPDYPPVQPAVSKKVSRICKQRKCKAPVKKKRSVTKKPSVLRKPSVSPRSSKQKVKLPPLKVPKRKAPVAKKESVFDKPPICKKISQYKQTPFILDDKFSGTRFLCEDEKVCQKPSICEKYPDCQRPPVCKKLSECISSPLCKKLGCSKPPVCKASDYTLPLDSEPVEPRTARPATEYPTIPEQKKIPSLRKIPSSKKRKKLQCIKSTLCTKFGCFEPAVCKHSEYVCDEASFCAEGTICKKFKYKEPKLKVPLCLHPPSCTWSRKYQPSPCPKGIVCMPPRVCNTKSKDCRGEPKCTKSSRCMKPKISRYMQRQLARRLRCTLPQPDCRDLAACNPPKCEEQLKKCQKERCLEIPLSPEFTEPPSPECEPDVDTGVCAPTPVCPDNGACMKKKSKKKCPKETKSKIKIPENLMQQKPRYKQLPRSPASPVPECMKRKLPKCCQQKMKDEEENDLPPLTYLDHIEQDYTEKKPRIAPNDYEPENICEKLECKESVESIRSVAGKVPEAPGCINPYLPDKFKSTSKCTSCVLRFTTSGNYYVPRDSTRALKTKRHKYEKRSDVKKDKRTRMKVFSKPKIERTMSSQTSRNSFRRIYVSFSKDLNNSRHSLNSLLQKPIDKYGALSNWISQKCDIKTNTQKRQIPSQNTNHPTNSSILRQPKNDENNKPVYQWKSHNPNSIMASKNKLESYIQHFWKSLKIKGIWKKSVRSVYQQCSKFGVDFSLIPHSSCHCQSPCPPRNLKDTPGVRSRGIQYPEFSSYDLRKCSKTTQVYAKCSIDASNSRNLLVDNLDPSNNPLKPKIPQIPHHQTIGLQSSLHVIRSRCNICLDHFTKETCTSHDDLLRDSRKQYKPSTIAPKRRKVKPQRSIYSNPKPNPYGSTRKIVSYPKNRAPSTQPVRKKVCTSKPRWSDTAKMDYAVTMSKSLIRASLPAIQTQPNAWNIRRRSCIRKIYLKYPVVL